MSDETPHTNHEFEARMRTSSVIGKELQRLRSHVQEDNQRYLELAKQLLRMYLETHFLCIESQAEVGQECWCGDCMQVRALLDYLDPPQTTSTD